MIITVSLYLRKKVESVSLRLQKCVQIAGAYVESGMVCVSVWDQNCSNVAFS